MKIAIERDLLVKELMKLEEPIVKEDIVRVLLNLPTEQLVEETDLEIMVIKDGKMDCPICGKPMNY